MATTRWMPPVEARGGSRGCPAAVSSRPPVTPRCPLAPGGGQPAVRLRSRPREPETALPAEPSASGTPTVSPVMDSAPKVAWWPAVRAPRPTVSAPLSRQTCRRAHTRTPCLVTPRKAARGNFWPRKGNVMSCRDICQGLNNSNVMSCRDICLKEQKHLDMTFA